MTNKLFIDDVRKPPDTSWHVSRTNTEAIAALRAPVGWTVISIDHDIVAPGAQDGAIIETFMPVIWYLQVCEADYSDVVVICHSFNDVARPVMVRKLAAFKTVIDARIGSKPYYAALREWCPMTLTDKQ